MRNRYRGFTTFNISAPRVRQLFVLLILGTAVLFIITGLFAMVQAERSVHSSLGRFTAHFSTETLLYMMGGEIPYLTSLKEVAENKPRISRMLFEVVTSVDPEDPRSFLGSELPGFALFDTEIAVAGEGVDYTSVPIESSPPPDLEQKLKEKDVTEEKPKKEEEEEKPASAPDKKQVFIYHTHFTESFLPELEGTDNPDRAYDNHENITKVGKRLGQSLENLGLGSEVSTKGYDVGWNRLYQASRERVVTAMKQNQDLKYLIDIHRDSQRREKTTQTINGKAYARIAFVIGTAHKNWEKNEQYARKLHKKMDQLYPGLSKGVFRKSRAMGNGEYNQSLSPNSILVEVGGVDNSFKEAYRTADALSKVIAETHFQATPVDARPGSGN